MPDKHRLQNNEYDFIETQTQNFTDQDGSVAQMS